jgi:hypothetical protein
MMGCNRFWHDTHPLGSITEGAAGHFQEWLQQDNEGGRGFRHTLGKVHSDDWHFAYFGRGNPGLARHAVHTMHTPYLQALFQLP